MVITKESTLKKRESDQIFCRRCKSKLSKTAKLRGLSVICPRCNLPV